MRVAGGDRLSCLGLLNNLPPKWLSRVNDTGDDEQGCGYFPALGRRKGVLDYIWTTIVERYPYGQIWEPVLTS